MASGIILAYSVAQLSQCYPDVSNKGGQPPKIWFFDIPKPHPNVTPPQAEYHVPSLPSVIPVPGELQITSKIGTENVHPYCFNYQTSFNFYVLN